MKPAAASTLAEPAPFRAFWPQRRQGLPQANQRRFAQPPLLIQPFNYIKDDNLGVVKRKVPKARLYFEAFSVEGWSETTTADSTARGAAADDQPHVGELRPPSKGVRTAIEATGAQLRYLPPYSPDLNPIEQPFAKFRAHLPKIAVRSVEALWSAIANTTTAFGPDECRNYIRHICSRTCPPDKATGR